jgi:hypothetical protein
MNGDFKRRVFADPAGRLAPVCRFAVFEGDALQQGLDLLGGVDTASGFSACACR